MTFEECWNSHITMMTDEARASAREFWNAGRAESLAELNRVQNYWLCVDGLTVAEFIAGESCPECGMGREHAVECVPAAAEAAKEGEE